jgi:hypothetical protein
MIPATQQQQFVDFKLCKQHMAEYYCIPPEDGLRTEAFSATSDTGVDCCLEGIIVKLITLSIV